MTVLWLRAIWFKYLEYGVFRGWLGVDFRFYFAQASILASGHPEKLYNLSAQDSFLQVLATYTRDPSTPLAAGQVPYPPLFAWLFVPFTLPPPLMGFALWTGLNLLLTVLLASRIAAGFPNRKKLWVFLALLTSLPMMYTIGLGQTTVLLALVFTEFYLALRAGREFRAGLWLACFLLKPQYAVLVGLLLIWKRRWAAIAGAAIGMVVILCASILLVGPSALLAMPGSLSEEAPFRGTDVTPVLNFGMVNWRALVLWAVPQIDDTLGLLAVLVLSVLTTLCLIPVWRGAWNTQHPLFAARMTLLLLATLLVSYHNHIQGAALLAFPIALVLASSHYSRLVRFSLGGLILIPTLTYTFTLNSGRAGMLLFLMIVLCFGTLLFELTWRDQAKSLEDPSYVREAFEMGDIWKPEVSGG